MREIKFRGKSKINGKWYAGHLTETRMLGTTIKRPSTGFCIPAIPETVGQFIGCYDKRGNEIYEGDIVQLEREKPYYPTNLDIRKRFYVTVFAQGFVCYTPTEFRIEKISSCGINFYDYMGDCFSWDDLKVIGNIWDNPELLI
jgi:uncharacterized phage protein (TIGR01671 family)